MKYKFLARPGFLQAMPFRVRSQGQAAVYIGRGPGLVSLQEPHELDADSAEGRELARTFQVSGTNYPLWPEDERTAKALGVPFVPVEFNQESGEWCPAPPAKSKKGE